MGDRTSVELTVRLADRQKVEALGGFDWHEFDLVDDGESPGNEQGIVVWYFYDINYAELEFESRLQELSIPYDKDWAAGSCYPGEETFRIKADGEPELKEFSEGMRGMISLDDVKSALADGTLPAYLAQAEKEVSHISWEEQEIILTNLKIKQG
jgi:hypothetical protein